MYVHKVSEVRERRSPGELASFGFGGLQQEICTKDEECRKGLFSECFSTVEFFVCRDDSLRKLNDVNSVQSKRRNSSPLHDLVVFSLHVFNHIHV